MRTRNFLAELKRRNVYKVAIAYGVVAWLLMQVASQIFPFFEIPNWAVRLVVLLLVIGFPVALVLAWAYELTPKGIKRTKSTGSVRRRPRGAVWLYVALIAGAMSIGLFFVGRYTAPKTEPAAAGLSSKSIAVLPFENLSADKENAYFVSGIQDEILTKLTAISDLKVISRASTEKYRSHPEDIKKAASELGVATILEGSVQKTGESAHINVQLIDARTDSHIWAQVYDRELKNIFAVEGEVAGEVASALKLKLLPEATAQLEAPPTKNPEAYDLYLHAGYAHEQWFRGTGNIEEAFEYLRAAIARDPNFARAYARLSIYESHKASEAPGLDPALERDARANAEKANSFQVDSVQMSVAMGLIYLYMDRNYSKAIECFERGPNRFSIPLAIAQGRVGHWSEAIETMRRVVELDPRDAHTFQVMAAYYGKTRHYGEAVNALDRAVALDPNNQSCVAAKAELLLMQGQTQSARETLKRLRELVRKPTLFSFSEASDPRWRTEFLLRNYPAAFQIADELSSAPPNSIQTGARELALGRTQLALGKQPEAMRTLDEARAKVEAVLSAHPNVAELHQRLARICAARSDKQRALEEAEKSITLLPLSKEPERGLNGVETLAAVYAHFADADGAIPLIDQLLNTEGTGLLITPALLKIEPIWDPIRNDPRFKKLCEENKP